MAQIRQVSDTRIRQLAETLRKNGLAASDSEAVRMATSMTKTEDRVTQQYDKFKEEAVMKTRFSTAPPKQSPAKTAQAPLQAASSQPPQSHSREEEVQASPQQPPAAKDSPLHANGAIAQAITNVKEQYAQVEVPTPDVNIDTSKSVEEILDGGMTRTVEQPVAQTPLQPQVAPQPVPNPPAQAQSEQVQPSVVEQPLPQQPQQTRVQQPAVQATPNPKAKNFAEANVDLTNVFDFSKK